jgi:SpoVK/Ycf46/Vps4 family AAA+-type ATPase
LEPPRIQKNIIDLLVMKPEGNKHMIKAICEIYGGTYTQTFTSDFISGKGEGQILLLHGPPGTGKTLTAGMYKVLFEPLPLVQSFEES